MSNDPSTRNRNHAAGPSTSKLGSASIGQQGVGIVDRMAGLGQRLWALLSIAATWLLRELRMTTVVVWNQLIRLFAWLISEYRLWLARRREWLAKVQCGEQMFSKGLGDEVIRNDLQQLNQRIANANTSWIDRWRLRFARLYQYHSLANCAEGFHDVVAATWHEVVNSSQAVAAERRRTGHARQQLLPSSVSDSLRLSSGSLLAVTIALLCGGLLNSVSPPENHEIGFAQSDAPAFRESPATQMGRETRGGEAETLPPVSLEGITSIDLEAITTVVRDLDLSDDGKVLAIGKPGEVLIHDTSTGALLRTFALQNKMSKRSNPSHVAVSSDGRYVVVGTDELVDPLSGAAYGQCLAWDNDKGNQVIKLSGIVGSVTGLDFSPNGKLVAVSQAIRDLDHPPTISVYDFPTGKLRWKISSPASLPLSYWSFGETRFRSDNQIVVATTYSGKGESLIAAVQIRDGFSGALKKELIHSTEERVPSLFFDVNPDGSQIVTCGSNRTARLWKNEALAHSLALDREITEAVLLRNGKNAVLACDGGKTIVIDTLSGKLIRELAGPEHIHKFAAATKADLFVCSERQPMAGKVYLWNSVVDTRLAWLVSSGKTWTIVTNSGFVDGTPEGIDYLVCEKNGKRQSASKLRSLIHRPDMVRRELQRR